MMSYATRIANLFAISGVLALCPLAPLNAADPMTAAEFESYVQGKTLYFGTDGAPYGVERYLGDRRVEWSFLDGDCKQGVWFENTRNQICFLYQDSPETHCWQFFREGTGLRAVFENDPDSTTLYEITDAEDPMMCHGPDLGV